MNSSPSKVSGNGWNYYPVEAAALEEAILHSADFHNLSEVSRFASSAVKIIAKQQHQIDELQAQVRALLALNRASLDTAANS